MAVLTDFTTTGKKVSLAVLTGESVTNPTAINAVTVQAPHAEVVHGHVSAGAATTFTLQGSADGTTWFTDGSALSAVTAATVFRFTNRWARYRVVAAKDAAGTTTVNVVLAALLQ